MKLRDEFEDPPIMLNTSCHENREYENPLFYLFLWINGLHLNNCMLDFGASINVIPLKGMKQLGLQVTWSYKNVCGIDSRRVKVCGLIKDLGLYLCSFPNINIKMDVAIIYVPNTWGILLSRKWVETLGGFLSMDLIHAHIPMVDGTF